MIDRITRLADVQKIKNHGLEKRPTDDSAVFLVSAPKLTVPVVLLEETSRVFVWTADGTWRMYPDALTGNFSKVDRGLGAVMALIAGNEGIDQEPVGHQGTLNRLKSWVYSTYKNEVSKLKSTGRVVSKLSDFVESSPRRDKIGK